MPIFSKSSIDKLNTCHPDLIALFNEVIKYFDCIVIEGHRDEKAQNEAYQTGKSKLKWPQSKHNSTPSLAVDVSPFPIEWKKADRFYWFAGFVLGLSEELKREGLIRHSIRSGCDWNGNMEIDDQSFNDLVHFEIKEDL